MSAIILGGLDQFCNAIQDKLKVPFIFFLKSRQSLNTFHVSFLFDFSSSSAPPLLLVLVFLGVIPVLLIVFLHKQNSMVPIEAIVPYDQGELLNSIHQIGMVERTVSSTSIFQ